MSRQLVSAVVAVAAGVTLMFIAARPAAGQTPPTSGRSWDPPRTTDGQPDIQGHWDTDDYASNVETRLQDAVSLKIQGMSDAAIAARKPISSIVDPPDGRIPYQTWAQARKQQILNRYGGEVVTEKPSTVRDVSPELLCTIGLPRIVYFAAFQVVQTPGYVLMSWERTREYRLIPLDTRPPLPWNVKLHMGDARGRWEGNTLVVHTTNLTDWSWFDAKGTIHTDAMTMDERYTVIDANTIRYQVTIQDPGVFTRPWTMVFNLQRRRVPADYEIMESACVEGERALANLLGDGHP
jgi:hypothetical protein